MSDSCMVLNIQDMSCSKLSKSLASAGLEDVHSSLLLGHQMTCSKPISAAGASSFLVMSIIFVQLTTMAEFSIVAGMSLAQNVDLAGVQALASLASRCSSRKMQSCWSTNAEMAEDIKLGLWPWPAVRWHLVA